MWSFPKIYIVLASVIYSVNFHLQACESQCLFQESDFLRPLPLEFCIMMQEFMQPFKAKHTSQKNVLILGGNPGVGKSLLAKEFVKRTGSFPITITTSSLSKSNYIGGSVRAIEEAFDQAQKHIDETQQRVVIIFEEIDAIAIPIQNASNNETKSAYQTFDVLVDKYKENKKLLVIGTTNRFEQCAIEFKDRCRYIHIDPPPQNTQCLLFKSMLLNGFLNQIEERVIEFRTAAALWRELVSLFDEIIRNIEDANIDSSTIDIAIHESRRLIKNIDDPDIKAAFNQMVTDFEIYRRDDFQNKKYEEYEFPKRINYLKRKYSATSSDLEKILDNMVLKIKKLNKRVKDEESIKIIEQEIENLSLFIRHGISMILVDFVKLLRTDLHILRQYYDLYFDEVKIKTLLTGHEGKSIRFFDYLFSPLKYYASQQELTDQAIVEVHSSAEQSYKAANKSENSDELRNHPTKTESFRNFLDNPKYRDAGIIALGVASHMGKVPWLHISRNVLSVLGDSIFPLAVIGDNLYELFLTIKDCAIKKDYLSPGDRALFNYYKKKEAFLDKMASMQSRESHKAYFEALQKRSERGLEEAKRGGEAAKEKEQRIREERKKLADEQPELDKQIEELRRELEVKYGEVT